VWHFRDISKRFTGKRDTVGAQPYIIGCIEFAVQDGIIQSNPMKDLTRFERPQQPQGNREYLTVDEMKRLVKTECIKPVVKLAFLFFCFSGLRFSDVKALKWGDIQTDNGGKWVIRYTQQKTGKDEYLQLSD
jgi:integrase